MDFLWVSTSLSFFGLLPRKCRTNSFRGSWKNKIMCGVCETGEPYAVLWKREGTRWNTKLHLEQGRRGGLCIATDPPSVRVDYPITSYGAT
ncbi:hypothetical protein E2C01_050742 [Portunus trituberculatus]|uniref:Uncharacterized protein n=1 Tax=Portunus trituberculatus TaxID=210409 RepID=A0A5B7GGT0_PORTR|nr:hypothetical protein [Portunus trituberculatus]